MHRTVLVLSLGLTSTAPTLAVAGNVVPAVTVPALAGSSVDNAALKYLAAWLEMSPELATAAKDALDNPGETWQEGSKVVALLESNQAFVRAIVAAAAIPDCDFELRYQDGFDLALPHLSRMRDSARILCADARRCAQAGQIDDAVQRIQAVYRMAAHASNDRVLISSLVGVAMASAAHAQVTHLHEAGVLAPAHVQAILAELQRINLEDPYNVRGSIAMERDIARDWLKRKFTGAGAARDFLAQMTAWDPDQPSEDPELTSMNQDAFYAQVDRASEYYDELLAVWGDEDAQEKLAALNERLEAGEFGRVAMYMVPALGKLRESASRFSNETRVLMESLAAPAAEPNTDPGS